MNEKLKEKKIYIQNAEKIVYKLSNETLNEKEVGNLIKQIEPYHYEEIVEERFVSKLCGYPCCGNELTNIPTKKYQISTKLNKVFELSDRKRYCCTECYKSSKYIEAQISTVPVWLRNTPEFLRDEGKNEIKFWSSNVKQKSQKAESILLNESKELEKDKMTQSLSMEVERELKQIEKDWTEKFKIKPETTEPTDSLGFKNMTPNLTKRVDQLSEEKNDAEFKERSELLKKKFIESMEIHKKPEDFTNLKNIFSFKLEKDQTEQYFGNGKTPFVISENNLPQLYFIEYIIQRILEIITTRSKEYLLQTEAKDRPTINEEREREEYLEACDYLVSKKTTLFKEIDYGDSDSKFEIKRSDYTQDDNGEQEMIAKLKSFEHLIEQRDNNNAMGNKEEKREEYDPETRKPLPDYAKLKEEAQKQQIRIREFFMGTPISKKREEVTIIDENNLNVEYNQNLVIKIKETDEEIVRVLPTIDSKSQSEIRRKIFFEKLVKYMEQLLKFSQFSYGSISNSLKNHVKNFVFSLKLTNENIIFSTNEWPILSLFILKILSMKKGLVNNAFDKLVKEDKLIETILTSFKLDHSKLENICEFIIRN